jgi:hypothetical protein
MNIKQLYKCLAVIAILVLFSAMRAIGLGVTGNSTWTAAYNTGNVTSGSYTGSTSGMGSESPPSAGPNSVWFKWQAPDNGTLTINTSGSAIDANMTFWSNNNPPVQLGRATDNITDDQAQLTPLVTANTTYYISIDGPEGNYQFNLSFTSSGGTATPTTTPPGGCISPSTGNEIKITSPVHNGVVQVGSSFTASGIARVGGCTPLTDVRVFLNWKNTPNYFWVYNPGNSSESWSYNDDQHAPVTVNSTGEWSKTFTPSMGLLPGKYWISISGKTSPTGPRISTPITEFEVKPMKVEIKTPTNNTPSTPLTKLEQVSGEITSATGTLDSVDITIKNSANKYWNGTEFVENEVRFQSKEGQVDFSEPNPTTGVRTFNLLSSIKRPRPRVEFPETYRIEAIARSLNPTNTINSNVVTVTVDTPATLQITTPVDGSPINALTAVSGNDTNVNGTLRDVGVYLKNSANQFWDGDSWEASNSTFVPMEESGSTFYWDTNKYDFPKPAAGQSATYKLSALGHDDSGPKWSRTVTVTVTPTLPTLAVSISNPANNSTFTNVPSAISGNVTGVVGALQPVKLYFKNAVGDNRWWDPNIVVNGVTGAWINGVSAVESNPSISVSPTGSHTFTATGNFPSAPAPNNSESYFIFAVARDSSRKADTNNKVTVTTAALDCKPDLWIRVDAPGEFAIGNNVRTAAGGNVQQRAASGAPGSVVKYLITVQNDSAFNDILRLHATVDGTALSRFPATSVTFKDGATDITSAIKNGTYESPSLATGGNYNIAMEVLIPTTAQGILPEDKLRYKITARSKSGITYVPVPWDEVFTETTSHKVQPDLMVRRSTEATQNALLDNVYYTGSSSLDTQTKDGSAVLGRAATYIATLQNDGQGTENFTLTQEALDTSVTGFQVKYFDTGADGTGNTEILTTTGANHPIASMAPGASRVIRIEVTPPATATGTVTKRYSLIAKSASYPSKEDRIAVKTIGYMPQPDLLIKREGDPSETASQNDYYQSDKQTRTGGVAKGNSIWYRVTLQNDGNAEDRFYLREERNSSSFATVTAKYYATERYGVDKGKKANEISSTVQVASPDLGHLYPPLPNPLIVTSDPLQPGESIDVLIQVTASAAANTNDFAQISLYAYSEKKASKNDRVVTLTATAEPKADTWIRLADDVNSQDLGKDVIHGVGGAVIATQTLNGVGSAGGKTRYIVTVQNDGTHTDAFRLQGVMRTSDGSAAFIATNAKYYRQTGPDSFEDISDAVRAGTYVTPYLAKNSVREYIMEIEPPANATPGEFKHYGLYAYSLANNSVFDRSSSQTYLQGIAKLQYSLDGMETWTDVPQVGQTGYPLTLDQDTWVDYRAIKAITTIGWPNGKPAWDGDYWDEIEIGEYSWELYDEYSVNAADLKTISAECGNVVFAKVKVMPMSNLLMGSDVNSILSGGIPAIPASTKLWASLVDKDNVPIPNVVVKFFAEYEDGTRAGQINGTPLTDDSATTNQAGIAEVTLKSSSKPGSVYIKATATHPAGSNLEDGNSMLFIVPNCTVSFGEWSLNASGYPQCSVGIQVTSTTAETPLGSFPITLVGKVYDSETGTLASSGLQSAAILGATTGTTDSSGEFSTTLTWIPPSGATPGPQKIEIGVIATSIQ